MQNAIMYQMTDFIEQRFAGEYREAVHRSDEMQRKQIVECGETNNLTEQKIKNIEDQARYRLHVIWQYFYKRHTEQL